MKSAVLEFRRDRVSVQQVDPVSIDILQTLADLRADLQCIEKAIHAVELLAATRLGLDTGGVSNSVSRKKRARASAAKRKGGVVAFPRLP
jgi:hypothetical protein